MQSCHRCGEPDPLRMYTSKTTGRSKRDKVVGAGNEKAKRRKKKLTSETERHVEKRESGDMRYSRRVRRNDKSSRENNNKETRRRDNVRRRSGVHSCFLFVSGWRSRNGQPRITLPHLPDERRDSPLFSSLYLFLPFLSPSIATDLAEPQENISMREKERERGSLSILEN